MLERHDIEFEVEGGDLVFLSRFGGLARTLIDRCEYVSLYVLQNLVRKAGAACATDRDRTSAPTISQCKLIARSRNVLRSPAAASHPLSAISPARIVI